MTRKIILSADNIFKYRLYGSRSWTILTAGEHEVEFSAGDRVEISSTSTVSHVKIKGHVKDVFVDSSEIETLDDSFSGTPSLDSVVINSSSQIKSMSGTFRDSGIVSFNIPTDDVVSFDSAFAETTRISDIDIVTSSASSLDNAFSDSSAKNIGDISSYSGSASSLLTGSKVVYLDGGFNAGDLVGSDISRSELSNKMISEMDIVFCRGKVAEVKDYRVIDDNVIDESMNFEMSIEPSEIFTREPVTEESSDAIDESMMFEMDIEPHEIITRGDFSIGEGLDDTFDGYMNLEADIELLNDVDASRRDNVVISTYLDTSSDIMANMIEFDYSQENSELSSTRRDDVLITTTLDESMDYNSYLSEFDLGYNEPYLNANRRDDVYVSTDLDDTFSPESYMLEFDMGAGYTDIDPFRDGSLVFSTGQESSVNRVDGSALPAPTGGFTNARGTYINSYTGLDFFFGANSSQTIDVSGYSPTSRSGFLTTLFARLADFDFGTGLLSTNSPVFLIKNGSSENVLGLLVSSDSSARIYNISLYGKNDGGFYESKISYQVGYLTSIESLCVTVDGSTYTMYVNGEDVGTGDITIADKSDVSTVTIGMAQNDTRSGDYKVFSRSLTSDEVRSL